MTLVKFTEKLRRVEISLLRDYGEATLIVMYVVSGLWGVISLFVLADLLFGQVGPAVLALSIALFPPAWLVLQFASRWGAETTLDDDEWEEADY